MNRGVKGEGEHAIGVEVVASRTAAVKRYPNICGGVAVTIELSVFSLECLKGTVGSSH